MQNAPPMKCLMMEGRRIRRKEKGRWRGGGAASRCKASSDAQVYERRQKKDGKEADEDTEMVDADSSSSSAVARSVSATHHENTDFGRHVDSSVD